MVATTGLSLAVPCHVSLFHLGPFKQFSVKWILFLQIIRETSTDFHHQELAELAEGVITDCFAIESGRGTHLGYFSAKYS